MPSPKALDNLISKLQSALPEIDFREDQTFTFRPPKTILFDPQNPDACLLILHEVGHFLNHDQDYLSDISLLRIEASAWERAKALAKQYKITWDEDFIQSKLDSYRGWLHQASLCPNCEINGYQDTRGYYHCPLCEQKWARQATIE